MYLYLYLYHDHDHDHHNHDHDHDHDLWRRVSAPMLAFVPHLMPIRPNQKMVTVRWYVM
jgi:hypothetical protein